MSCFHYRWLPCTIFPNLWGFCEDTFFGICNVVRWAPVIWSDADWDWAYIAKVLEYKLRRHAAVELTVGHHVGSAKDGRQMLVCAELLKRLQEDEYDRGYEVCRREDRAAFFARADKRRKYDQWYLGHIIGKHLTHWWD